MRAPSLTLLCLLAATAGPAFAQEDTTNTDTMAEEVMADDAMADDAMADDAMADDAPSLEEIAASDPNVEVTTNQAG